DPATDSFSDTGSLLGPVSRAKAVSLPDGRVLVLPTTPPGTPGLPFVQIYEPANGTFVQGPGVPSFMGGAVALLPSGKVLLAGTDIGDLRRAVLFDPGPAGARQFAVTDTGSMQTHHAFGTATVLLDGRVLIAGEASAELYDPAQGTFTDAGPLVAPRQGHTATLLPENGRVLLAGGTLDGQKSGEVFDLALGSLYFLDLQYP